MTDTDKGAAKAGPAPKAGILDIAPYVGGKARIEGKDYVMHDGDVVEFRFNV